ncbi:MAG: S1-like domain-containing RNA-binding protein [Methylomonas sp.]|jgi:predicted RNA-binding protein (virulence factor B family)
MLALGKTNTLTVTRGRDEEIFVDCGAYGEIRLQPAPDESISYQPGAAVVAFVYIDGRNQLQATRIMPKAQADEVAWLKVAALSDAGAFLDWGLPKDLLAPFNEQKMRMAVGRFYLVRLFLDEDNRIVASARLDDFISDQAYYFKAGQQVELIIANETDLGFKAVVDHQYWGMLYKNELFQPLHIGQKLTGYIKNIRPDHKIDLILDAHKYGEKVDVTLSNILAVLEKHGGFIALTDKSPPDMIYATFGVSKKVFKQAIGRLYKQRLIVIEEQGLRSTKQPH